MNLSKGYRRMSTRMFDPAEKSDQAVVLFVDDDAPNRQAFQAAFRKVFQVLTAGNREEAWAFLRSRKVDVVIADERMPGTAGHELLKQVKESFPTIRRMVVTGYSDIQAVIKAVNEAGIVRYFPKPWNVDEIARAVRDAYSEIRSEQEQKALHAQLLESNRQLEFALRQRLLS
ncbi:MAG: response regulator [Flavobacteriales bacterium]|nr:response regulator [Flavobacteriales bacterium]